MKLFWIIILAFVSSSCVTYEKGRYIVPQDLAFIEKGKTTRAEVIERLGPPFSETADLFQSEPTTTTTQTKITVTPEDGTQEEQIMITYDEAGVVQDYSFNVVR